MDVELVVDRVIQVDNLITSLFAHNANFPNPRDQLRINQVTLDGHSSYAVEIPQGEAIVTLGEGQDVIVSHRINRPGEPEMGKVEKEVWVKGCAKAGVNNVCGAGYGQTN